MSPRWSDVAGYGLYFYYNERHQRPHVDVRRRGGRDKAVVDVNTGDVLAGRLSHGAHNAVKAHLEKNREAANQAFHDAREGKPPRTLDINRGIEGR